ncbi:importin beta11 isoform X2 [Arctopsyche grandis]|uniref:importin beta11 isoform X2 n=1 Tax=Arctopsyche grandis TaxID=121162 RepID=UPI00406D78F0
MDPNNVYAVVLDTLHRASNQDVEILKPAASKLSEWETERGFYPVLLSIFSNHSIDSNVRWLAAVTFKNGVDRYWRKNAPNGITEDEKRKLRQDLLSPSLLIEPVSQIASQLAVLVAKIARYDCPTEWPDLVPGLLNAMKTSTPLEQHRALLMFHHIVKALSTKRLLSDKRIFQELTTTVFSYILSIWDKYTQIFLQQIHEGADTITITENLEKALYSLKILKRLIINGFKKPHESHDALAFLNMIFDRAKSSLECRKLLKGRGIYLLELCEKYIIHLTKVALGTLEIYPLSYVSLVAPSLEFTAYYCFTEQGMHLAFERFTVQCLNLLKAILLCSEYKIDKMSDQSKDPAAVRARDIKQGILTDQTVCHMCRTLVTHFLLLTSDDLALWDADAESFATDATWGTWKCNLRPCSESVFLTLFHEFTDIVINELISLLKMIRQEPVNPNNLPMILRKDAIYNAVGLVATDLFDEVDFDEWFSTQLIAELKIKDGNYRIIRRRTAWLIGTWSRVKVSLELRPILYQSLLELLSDTEDVAVRLAACDALSMTIDDFNFSADQFAPFVQSVFVLLFALLKEADECDTKMHILTVLSLIAERNGEAVSHHTSELLSYLPLLWDHADQHNMLRCAIVSTLVQLVKALGYWSTPEMQPLVLGVLDEATNPKRPAHVYLLEDGLELWKAVLEATPIPIICADQLLHLAGNLPSLLETTEYLRLGIDITNAYLLLMPVEFLLGPGDEFFKKLDDMLSDMQMEGVVEIFKLAEICLKVQMPEPNELLGIKVIWPMFRKIILGFENGHPNPSLISLRLSLISRLLLRSMPLFLEAIKETSVSCNCDPNEILMGLLDESCDRISLVVQPERRKIIGLGLSVLLTSQIPCVLGRFPAIMQNITEILNDIMKSEDNGAYVDGLIQDTVVPSSPSDSWNRFCPDTVESQHDIRARQLTMMDVIHNVDIRTFLTNQIVQLRNQAGQEAFDKLVKSIHPTSLEQLREYVQI